jgi:hypothetical protein
MIKGEGSSLKVVRNPRLAELEQRRYVSRIAVADPVQWRQAVIGCWLDTFDGPGAAGVRGSRLPIVPEHYELDKFESYNPRTAAHMTEFEHRILSTAAPQLYPYGLRVISDKILRGGVSLEGWGELTTAVMDPDQSESFRLSLLEVAENALWMSLIDGVSVIALMFDETFTVAGSTMTALNASSIMDIVCPPSQVTRLELATRTGVIVYEIKEPGGGVLMSIYDRKDPGIIADSMKVTPVVVDQPLPMAEIPFTPIYTGRVDNEPFNAVPPFEKAVWTEHVGINLRSRAEASASNATQTRIALLEAPADAAKAIRKRGHILLIETEKIEELKQPVEPILSLFDQATHHFQNVRMDLGIVDQPASTGDTGTEARTATEVRVSAAGNSAFLTMTGKAVESALTRIARIIASSAGERDGTVTVGYEISEAAAQLAAEGRTDELRGEPESTQETGNGPETAEREA